MPDPTPVHVIDHATRQAQPYPSLHAAMVALLRRYPEAVFSDGDFAHEPTIWVWPSNTASMHAAPADAVARIEARPEEDPHA